MIIFYFQGRNGQVGLTGPLGPKGNEVNIKSFKRHGGCSFHGRQLQFLYLPYEHSRILVVYTLTNLISIINRVYPDLRVYKEILVLPERVYVLFNIF